MAKVVNNVDTKQMEEMRAKVVEQELSARSWKAYYEKMYFSMEAEKLEPLYQEYKVRLDERIKKEREEYEAFMKKMQESLPQINAESPVGEATITEAPVIQM